MPSPTVDYILGDMLMHKHNGNSIEAPLILTNKTILETPQGLTATITPVTGDGGIYIAPQTINVKVYAKGADYAGSNFYSASYATLASNINLIASTLTEPTDVTGTINMPAGSVYDDTASYNFTIRVYSYKNVGASKEFSSLYTEFTVTNEGKGSDNFTIDWSWTGATGADGYRVALTSTYWGYNFDAQPYRYIDVTNTYLTDDGTLTWLVGYTSVSYDISYNWNDVTSATGYRILLYKDGVNNYDVFKDSVTSNLTDDGTWTTGNTVTPSAGQGLGLRTDAYVGFGIDPVYPLDVLGNTRIAGSLGVGGNPIDGVVTYFNKDNVDILGNNIYLQKNNLTIPNGSNTATVYGSFSLLQTNATAITGSVYGTYNQMTINNSASSVLAGYFIVNASSSSTIGQMTGFSLQASTGGVINSKMYGGVISSNFSGTGSITDQYGGYFSATVAQVSGSINTVVPQVYGGYFYAEAKGHTSISNLVAGYFEIANQAYSGQNPATTSIYGMFVKNSVTYAPSYMYGIYVGGLTQGSVNNYAIYTNAGQVHFGDSVDLSSGKNIALTAGNILTDTTTGTKIGTGTTQKIAFWNATPIVQPTTGISGASFTANSGTAVNDASTFDGYTLKQIVKAMRNMGQLA